MLPEERVAYFFAAIWWVSHAMTAFGGLPFGLSLLALTLLVLYMAVHWAAAFAISWRIRAGLGWPMVVHLPVVWTALELCRNYLFSGFPWANLGYTQVRTLPVAQLAALAGVAGSFYGHYTMFLSPELFAFYNTVTMVVMVSVPGRRDVRYMSADTLDSFQLPAGT